MANTTVRTYTAPEKRGLPTSLFLTLLLVVLLPVGAPIFLTFLISKVTAISAGYVECRQIAECSIAFVGTGELALSSVFLSVAVLCDGALKRRDLIQDAVITCFITLGATSTYAIDRINSFQDKLPHTIDFMFYLSCACYLVATANALIAPVREWHGNR